MDKPDVLLQGALDLHAHASPELTSRMPGRLSNTQWARLAARCRMRGYVIKSHLFPTTGIANTLQPEFPELEIFSSITLNPTSGGLSPLAVECAIEAGAKVVWMPTWSARQQSLRPSVFLERMERFITRLEASRWPVAGLSVSGEDGSLTPQVREIVRLCAERDVVVASGHLPPSASLTLCEAVIEAGGRFILTHPLSSSVAASLEDQCTVARMGGFVEHVFVGCMPMHQRMDPVLIVEAIKTVGAERCVMSTDAIESWNPPQPELLRMFIATMLSLGISDEDVHAMTHENPAKALGLDPSWNPRRSEPALRTDGLA
jgi:Family of unknown function (DUF6282)